jgi:hypothetical protein
MDRPKLELIANRTLEDPELVTAFRQEAAREQQEENQQPDKRSRVQLRREPLGMKQYQFKPGISGNPKGRPVARKVSNAVVERLAQVEPETGMTYAELIAHALVYRAIRGDVSAAREIREVTEGSTQRVELSGSMLSVGFDIENASNEQLDQIIQSFLERGVEEQEQGQYQHSQEEQCPQSPS